MGLTEQSKTICPMCGGPITSMIVTFETPPKPAIVVRYSNVLVAALVNAALDLDALVNMKYSGGPMADAAYRMREALKPFRADSLPG